MISNRLLYIDFLKAFAIFSVVYGHVLHQYFINIEIAGFLIPMYNMPLFAIMSRLFFSAKEDVRPFISKKFTQLALPFLVWCFIVAILVRGVNDVWLHFMTGLDIHIMSWVECYVMYVIDWGWWFIRDLFVSFVCAYWAIRLCRRNVLLGVCLSVLIIYVMALTGIFPNKWNKEFVLLYPFFCAGILMKNYNDVVMQHAKQLLWVVAITFAVCMFLWQGYSDTFYSMNTSMLAEEGYAGITGWMVPVKMIYRYITGVSASFMLILLARRLEVYLPTSPLMMRIGRNTLGIYILHGFVFQILPPPVQTYCSKTR